MPGPDGPPISIRDLRKFSQAVKRRLEEESSDQASLRRIPGSAVIPNPEPAEVVVIGLDSDEEPQPTQPIVAQTAVARLSPEATQIDSEERDVVDGTSALKGGAEFVSTTRAVGEDSALERFSPEASLTEGVDVPRMRMAEAESGSSPQLCAMPDFLASGSGNLGQILPDIPSSPPASAAGFAGTSSDTTAVAALDSIVAQRSGTDSPDVGHSEQGEANSMVEEPVLATTLRPSMGSDCEKDLDASGSVVELTRGHSDYRAGHATTSHPNQPSQVEWASSPEPADAGSVEGVPVPDGTVDNGEEVTTGDVSLRSRGSECDVSPQAATSSLAGPVGPTLAPQAEIEAESTLDIDEAANVADDQRMGDLLHTETVTSVDSEIAVGSSIDYASSERFEGVYRPSVSPLPNLSSGNGLAPPVRHSAGELVQNQEYDETPIPLEASSMNDHTSSHQEVGMRGALQENVFATNVVGSSSTVSLARAAVVIESALPTDDALADHAACRQATASTAVSVAADVETSAAFGVVASQPWAIETASAHNGSNGAATAVSTFATGSPAAGVSTSLESTIPDLNIDSPGRVSPISSGPNMHAAVALTGSTSEVSLVVASPTPLRDFPNNPGVQRFAASAIQDPSNVQSDCQPVDQGIVSTTHATALTLSAPEISASTDVTISATDPSLAVSLSPAETFSRDEIEVAPSVARNVSLSALEPRGATDTVMIAGSPRETPETQVPLASASPLGSPGAASDIAASPVSASNGRCAPSTLAMANAAIAPAHGNASADVMNPSQSHSSAATAGVAVFQSPSPQTETAHSAFDSEVTNTGLGNSANHPAPAAANHAAEPMRASLVQASSASPLGGTAASGEVSGSPVLASLDGNPLSSSLLGSSEPTKANPALHSVTESSVSSVPAELSTQSSRVERVAAIEGPMSTNTGPSASWTNAGTPPPAQPPLNDGLLNRQTDVPRVQVQSDVQAPNVPLDDSAKVAKLKRGIVHAEVKESELLREVSEHLSETDAATRHCLTMQEAHTRLAVKFSAIRTELDVSGVLRDVQTQFLMAQNSRLVRDRVILKETTRATRENAQKRQQPPQSDGASSSGKIADRLRQIARDGRKLWEDREMAAESARRDLDLARSELREEVARVGAKRLNHENVVKDFFARSGSPLSKATVAAAIGAARRTISDLQWDQRLLSNRMHRVASETEALSRHAAANRRSAAAVPGLSDQLESAQNQLLRTAGNIVDGPGCNNDILALASARLRELIDQERTLRISVDARIRNSDEVNLSQLHEAIKGPWQMVSEPVRETTTGSVVSGAAGSASSAPVAPASVGNAENATNSEETLTKLQSCLSAASAYACELSERNCSEISEAGAFEMSVPSAVSSSSLPLPGSPQAAFSYARGRGLPRLAAFADLGAQIKLLQASGVAATWGTSDDRHMAHGLKTVAEQRVAEVASATCHLQSELATARNIAQESVSLGEARAEVQSLRRGLQEVESATCRAASLHRVAPPAMKGNNAQHANDLMLLENEVKRIRDEVVASTDQDDRAVFSCRWAAASMASCEKARVVERARSTFAQKCCDQFDDAMVKVQTLSSVAASRACAERDLHTKELERKRLAAEAERKSAQSTNDKFDVDELEKRDFALQAECKQVVSHSEQAADKRRKVQKNQQEVLQIEGQLADIQDETENTERIVQSLQAELGTVMKKAEDDQTKRNSLVKELKAELSRIELDTHRIQEEEKDLSKTFGAVKHERLKVFLLAKREAALAQKESTMKTETLEKQSRELRSEIAAMKAASARLDESWQSEEAMAMEILSKRQRWLETRGETVPDLLPVEPVHPDSEAAGIPQDKTGGQDAAHCENAVTTQSSPSSAKVPLSAQKLREIASRIWGRKNNRQPTPVEQEVPSVKPRQKRRRHRDKPPVEASADCTADGSPR